VWHEPKGPYHETDARRHRGAALLCLGTVAAAQDAPPHGNCQGFISVGCCCTNNCCFTIRPGDLQQVSDDTYKVVASGQVLPRTGWSADGQTWRCACDSIDGQWVVHASAYTRCIYCT
jgi:hypothetical protein